MNKKSGFVHELQKRNVIKVAAGYLIASWLIAQVADLVFPNFGAPDWAMRALLTTLAVGFPIALLISWAFEVTPQGVIPESAVDRTISIKDNSGKRLDRTIIAILGIVIVFMGLERFVFDAHDKPSVAPPTQSQPAEAGEAESVVPPAAGAQENSPDENSVAVLPFAVMSTGPDDEYFADGLTEEIINSLSQLPDLMVTARTSAFHFKGQNIPIGEIARQLGVAHVVEGSVRRAGDQLRITVQLIRAKDGFHLWSETYDRRTEDTFVVHADIAEKIATAMDVVLDDQQRQMMRQVGTKNVDAFIAYQKGVEYVNRAHAGADLISLLRQANIHFEEAIQLYPKFSDAYIYHSDLMSHILLSSASGELDGNITAIDIESAPATLRRDYDNAILYATSENQKRTAEADRALLLGAWKGLKGVSRRALTATGCDVALWAQLTSGAYGDAQLLFDAYQRKSVCDPLANSPAVHMVLASLWLGKFAQAEQIARQSLEKEQHHWVLENLALSLALQGNDQAAAEVINERMQKENNRMRTSLILAALQGDAERAANLQDDYLAKFGPNEREALHFEAIRGRRNEANRLAGMIDSRPFGYFVLQVLTYACLCGAPFDLEATPVFAGMLADSGLVWPPASPINFPLKDW